MELLVVLVGLALLLIGAGVIWAWRAMSFVLVASNLHSGLCREQTKAPEVPQRIRRQRGAMAPTLG
jgi:hypothetical protein